MRKYLVVIFLVLFASLFFLVGCTPPPSPTPTPTPEVPSEVIVARDWGITQANLEGKMVPINAVWTAENITPQGLLGYTTFRFIYIDQNGTWTIEVGYPIVLEPIYDVKIFKNGQQIWEGSKAIPYS